MRTRPASCGSNRWRTLRRRSQVHGADPALRQNPFPMTDGAAAGRVLKSPSFDRARLLRRWFRDVNYTEKGLLQVFGVVEAPMPHLRNLPRLLDLTRTPTPRNALIRWFLLGMPVDRERARRSLPEEVLATCLES